MFLHNRLVFLSLIAAFGLIISLAFGATLPQSEVEALKDIAKTLGKRNWNFSVDPCSGKEGWADQNPVKGFENAVTCNCSFSNGTICHVVSISLLVNRLTGPIPRAFANISTLTSLAIEYNHFSGVLPPELGNLPRLERILLGSNNFTGELPETFAKLVTLKDLVIQASGLVGPIPSGIASLSKLTDLRISDLNGTEAPFPPLDKMKKMKTLILRSCNISGKLPDYLGLMTDVSFNKLNGAIPSTFMGLLDVDYIYLTGNLLTGTIPPWMLQKGDRVDLSYNNFTAGSSETSCQYRSVNLFASSSKGNNSYTNVTLPAYYSVHINCGGKQVTVDGNTTFEDDTDEAGPSRFAFRGSNNWAFSNTGHFLDDDRPADTYIQTNTSILLMNDSQLYTRARISPISLTYYGFCLGNGNYTASLHFAEIMFTNDKTYSSFGRRIFDVYIQGKLVLKDFNIEDEAGGIGKAIVRKIPVVVTNSTIEIHLYWAGKGTTGVPVRGVYGPLISAISLNPGSSTHIGDVCNAYVSLQADFIPPSENGSSSSISAGTVVGIVAATTFVIILLVGILWWKGCFRPEHTLEQELKGVDLLTGSFTLRQIKAATNNFAPDNKIGEGGFGPVYKGHMADGTVVAVKQLSSKSKQGNREFVNEIGMISALQHPNLVKLHGCCIEGNQLLLIYEYMENNSLARALFGPEAHRLKLDWPTRHRICVGIARGLAYLHEESRLKIVHRDIKATNVLLDKDLNPKISDFGLAKLDEEDNTHISTRVAGTFGYMAPEYAMRGYLTDKADVYSFGIVALEIVSGRSNSSCKPKEDIFYLLDWALILKAQGNLMELVDKRLGSNFDKEQVMVMINVALLCTDVSSTSRPSMSSVVSMLEGRADVQDFVPDSSVVSNIDKTKSEAIRNYYEFSEEQSMDGCQTQSMSIDGPYTGSSTSAADLYPINLDSDYLNSRV
ncbi:putative leucine-rich repeat receptor-like serine/threonine-protein kinase [Citrus sinensis]|uniref:Leucine-rich repeat receptor-like serine/threonine-protein kinase n=1 Tax=Citrus sinensis TaxID=2711 RepID=A0ACB8M0R4_CITSI|nr:putative leucine-rich repeat receptor-like serine/threonine-protein kinase [Citrus sinensis]